jgi:hypothetical protein
VGQQRAKTHLKCALRTQDHEIKLRRLQQFQYNTLDKDDFAAKELTRIAKVEATQLQLRFQNHDILDSIQVNQTCKVDKVTLGCASKKASKSGESYTWIMRANNEEDRSDRRKIRDQTELAIECRGYIIGMKPKAVLQKIDSMLNETRLISSKNVWPEGQVGVVEGRAETGTKISIEKGVVFQVARRETLAGRRVAAVNAASAYHTGGGFSTGGRHALEEAMCIQSTLYASLKKATRMAEEAKLKVVEWANPPQPRTGGDWLLHIPDDGVVLSPSVEVFRGGTMDGYPFEEAPVALEAVISVAMPNLNDRMSDSPVDGHPEPEEYIAQVKRKWRAVFTAAAHYTGADTLVVPDAGCGVFANPPDKLGTAFGEVLREEFASCFKEVFIAFPGNKNGEVFAEHASAAFEKRPAIVSLKEER